MNIYLALNHMPDEEDTRKLDVIKSELSPLGVMINLEEIETGREDRPSIPCLIIDCDTYQTRTIRTRYAGRKPNFYIPYDSPLRYGSTVGEVLEFIDSHTPSDGAEALGLAESTYYKRKRQLKALVAQDPDKAERVYCELLMQDLKEAERKAKLDVQ